MKPRIQCFDVLKGIAILLVVMGHVITYGVYKIDSSLTFRIIGTVHMPLFFFISGYFTVRRRNGLLAVPNLRSRFMRLVVPMVIISSIWILYYPHSGLPKHLTCTFAGLWSDQWKNGYWFTPVLFAIILLYSAAARLSNRMPRNSRTLQALPFALLLAAVSVSEWLIPSNVSNCLSFSFIFTFIWVFLFGGFAALTGEKFIRFATSTTGYTLSLAISVVLFIMLLYPDFIPFHSAPLVVLIERMLLHCSLAVMAIGFCYPLTDGTPGASRSRGVRFWSLLGRKSLQIYLFHYFFLFPMASLRHLLQGMALDFVPVTAVALAASLLIIACCLGVDALLSRSPLLSVLIGYPAARNKK